MLGGISWLRCGQYSGVDGCGGERDGRGEDDGAIGVDMHIVAFVGVELDMVLQVGVQVNKAVGGLYSYPQSFLRQSPLHRFFFASTQRHLQPAPHDLSDLLEHCDL